MLELRHAANLRLKLFAFPYWMGCAVASFFLLILVVAGQIFYASIGELDISSVVSRQLARGPNRLFLSGVHQQALPYKMALMDRIRPQVVAIGSSRAMQVRGEFFARSFTNLGGSANSIPELELLAGSLAHAARRPSLAIVFVDPWWFSDKFSEAYVPATASQYPRYLFGDLLIETALLLRNGNWLSRHVSTRNLGIFAMLKNEGFSRDGSYDYLATVTGQRQSGDIHFSYTMGLIAQSGRRFERGAHADPLLVARACRSLASIRENSDHLIVIAPPLAPKIWREMSRGGFDYIAVVNRRLQQCLPGTTFIDAVDPARLPGATDCEFFDGFHGGDTVYARILARIASIDPAARASIDFRHVDAFISRYSGSAAGGTIEEYPGIREIDFLRLGCSKSLH